MKYQEYEWVCNKLSKFSARKLNIPTVKVSLHLCPNDTNTAGSVRVGQNTTANKITREALTSFSVRPCTSTLIWILNNNIIVLIMRCSIIKCNRYDLASMQTSKLTASPNISGEAEG